MLPHFAHLRIHRCPRCGLVFHDCDVNAEVLYQGSYFKGEEYLNYPAEKLVLQRNFAGYIRHLRRWSAGGRLLEIGCAYGFFLEMARCYWSDVRGTDVTAEGIAHAKSFLGTAVRQGDFLTMEDDPMPYDVVCLWDTLEHLSHPVQTITKAARSLKRGGILALTTGDLGSWMARFRGERWRLIHPPTHLFYFSKATLTLALRSAGLEILEMTPVGYSRSFRAMLYRIFALNGKKSAWIYRLLTAKGRWDFPVYLNLFDILFVAARRP